MKARWLVLALACLVMGLVFGYSMFARQSTQIVANSKTRPQNRQCTAPDTLLIDRLGDARLAEMLAGRYELIVVAKSGFVRDTVARGNLELAPTQQGRMHSPVSDRTYPVSGLTDVDFASLGPVNFAYSPASSDLDYPGVQASFDSGDGQLELMFGNAEGPKGVATDVGVMFSVLHLDSAGMQGWWRYVGLPLSNRPQLEGYFCAIRNY